MSPVNWWVRKQLGEENDHYRWRLESLQKSFTSPLKTLLLFPGTLISPRIPRPSTWSGRERTLRPYPWRPNDTLELQIIVISYYSPRRLTRPSWHCQQGIGVLLKAQAVRQKFMWRQYNSQPFLVESVSRLMTLLRSINSSSFHTLRRVSFLSTSESESCGAVFRELNQDEHLYIGVLTQFYIRS